jgi:hypothetical protein
LRSARVLVLILCCMTAACATTTYHFRPGDYRVVLAVQGPLRDLGVMREEPPEILTRAVDDPYALLNGFDCDANNAEVAELDQVLGPDLRLPGESQDRPFIDPPGLIAGVISGAVGLPYSSVIRRLTGAARRDRALRGAIIAGMVRRSFLRGVLLSQGCQASDATDEEHPAAEPVQSPSATNGVAATAAVRDSMLGGAS